MVGKKLLSAEVPSNLKSLCPKQLSAVDTFSKQCVSDSATKFIFGRSGSGKTHLAAMLAKSVIGQDGFVVLLYQRHPIPQYDFGMAYFGGEHEFVKPQDLNKKHWQKTIVSGSKVVALDLCESWDYPPYKEESIFALDQVCAFLIPYQLTVKNYVLLMRLGCCYLKKR